MAEENKRSIASWKDRWLSLRSRHQGHVKRAGETAQMVGQSVIASVSGFAIGVADQKWATAEPGYANLGMLKVGPVPLSLVAGAAGLGAAVYGHGESWAPWAEALGAGGLAAYSVVQGRRMTIDWQKQAAK